MGIRGPNPPMQTWGNEIPTPLVTLLLIPAPNSSRLFAISQSHVAVHYAQRRVSRVRKVLKQTTADNQLVVGGITGSVF